MWFNGGSWDVVKFNDIPSGTLKKFATQKMAIEIVDLPNLNMVIFHSLVVCLPEGIFHSYAPKDEL
jgi:hypothetical protein